MLYFVSRTVNTLRELTDGTYGTGIDQGQATSTFSLFALVLVDLR